MLIFCSKKSIIFAYFSAAYFCILPYFLIAFFIGVLLDDLLVAEDLAAAETTMAASHAAAANAQACRRYTFGDERTRQQAISEGEVSDGSGAVVLGSPVAPPENGDMYTDISADNIPGPRYLLG